MEDPIEAQADARTTLERLAQVLIDAYPALQEMDAIALDMTISRYVPIREVRVQLTEHGFDAFVEAHALQVVRPVPDDTHYDQRWVQLADGLKIIYTAFKEVIE